MIDIDLRETRLANLGLLKYLLYNQAFDSAMYVFWGTDNYDGHNPEEEIVPEYLIGNNRVEIKPRVIKEKEEQKNRTKDKAEVFTPTWMCKVQNDQIDELWYKTHKKSDWKSYVLANRMEITCGEAPYLVSRYDTTTGEAIESVWDRIGLLDRKLQLISKNVKTEKSWLEWAKEAYKHTYGYEWQGDSLLLARENLYATFIDFHVDKFGKEPSLKDQIEVCEIISWNIFQMDGLTFNIPMTDIPVKIMDWDEDKTIYFKDLGSESEPATKKKKGRKKNLSTTRTN